VRLIIPRRSSLKATTIPLPWSNRRNINSGGTCSRRSETKSTHHAVSDGAVYALSDRGVDAVGSEAVAGCCCGTFGAEAEAALRSVMVALRRCFRSLTIVGTLLCGLGFGTGTETDFTEWCAVADEISVGFLSGLPVGLSSVPNWLWRNRRTLYQNQIEAQA
jgi:hypothetical protein